MNSVEEQERLFRNWMKHENTGKGALSNNTINQYINCMKAAYDNFNEIKDHESLFDIQNSKELNEYITKLFNSDSFPEYNSNNSHSSCRSGFLQYRAFLEEQNKGSEQEYYSDFLTKDLYGIKIVKNNTAVSEDNPHICIGWSELGDLTGITSIDSLAQLYDNIVADPKDRKYYIGVLWKMRNEIKKGDYVVYGSKNILNVGRVISDYYYDDRDIPGQDKDYAHNRKVKWILKGYDKSVLPKSIQDIIGVRGQIIWDMNKHRQAIYDILCGKYNKDNGGPEENGDKEDNKCSKKLVFNTNFSSEFLKNRIVFGAPGTGKSFLLNQDREKLIGEDNEIDYERVTFHPEYSYANFVGTYKPVMVKNESGEPKDEKQKKVISILEDKNKTAQEKYDLLYDVFKGDSLTRLPILLGIYTDETFNTKKLDGEFAVNNNNVERNHGRAIRPYLNLNTTADGKKEISYAYVPGPFMRILVKALKSAMAGEEKPFLLLIEEINRANVAGVFGDVFQLLDRNKDGVSEFPIATSEDMRAYLAEELGVEESVVESIRIPNNMFIWATMNSADQGVYPMDTAFKRRWDFEYLSIDEKQDAIADLQFKHLASGQTYAWNDLRKAINDALIGMNVNEDKLLGPFFLQKSAFDTDEKFAAAFKSKVLMYLFEDAARQRRSQLFIGCGKDCNIFSRVCQQFDEIGLGIFGSDFLSKVPVLATEAQEAKEEQ